jgi:hypothetical protein
VYLAERVTDPPLGARLVDAGALSAAELEHGTIRIGELDHLGRLFERSPSVDRHRVLVLVEMMSDEATTWVAGQQVRGAVVLPYEMHPSGVHHWDRERDRTVVLLEGTGAALPPPVPGTAVLTAEVVIGDVDQLADDVRIEWADAAWLGTAEPVARASGDTGTQVALAPPVVTTGPGFPAGPDEVPPLTGADLPGDVSDDIHDDARDQSQLAVGLTPVRDADSAVVALVAADDVVDDFEVIWPTGEVEREFPPPLDVRGDVAVPTSGPLTWDLRMPTPSLDLTTAGDADLVDELAEEVAQAVRRAIAAIAAGHQVHDGADAAAEGVEVTGSVAGPHRHGTADPATDTAAEAGGDVGGDQGADPGGPIIVRSSTLTEAEAEAARRMSQAGLDAGSADTPRPSGGPADPDRGSPWLPDPLFTTQPRPAPTPERTGALRRLIASLRRR